MTENETVKPLDVKPAERNKRGGLFKFILILFLLAFIAGGLYWTYNEGQKLYSRFSANSDSQKVINPQPLSVESAETETDLLLPAKQGELIVSPLPPMVADVEPAQTPVIAPVVSAQSNKNFILYLAARDLRDSLNDPVQFKKELGFIKTVSISFPELQSKIEILEIVASEGIPTHETLLADIKKLRIELRNKNHGSFVTNLQNSLGRLVTITKIDGNVDSSDYNSIIKRAEIAIQNSEFALAETELKKLGADSVSITSKINNLSNAAEIAEYIVDFAKAKIVSQE